jgi:ABC-2 type transport system ATP-binding protein
MIEVCNLTKSYGQMPAVRDLSFHVREGEILGFLGPNGAGKTTTMRILAGCLAPTGGTARIAGHDIFEESLEARRCLGYLPEQVPLYPEMRVTEYLAFAGALRGMSSRAIAGRMDEVLARCGLTQVRRMLIGRLSRGYRQRVGLAQALFPNPPVLILDEPTVGLDPRQIVEVRDLIRGLANAHTILLSTHILPEVSMVCTRVVIIDHGRLVAEDTLQHMVDGALEGERLVAEIGGPAEAVAALLRSVEGVASVSVRPRDPGEAEGDASTQFAVQISAGKPSAAVRGAVSQAVVGAGHRLLELRSERATLEDVFVRVTATEAQ